ncbi:MAG: DUF4142 domain-containing protein [Bacteroidia bacterium]
MKSIKKFKPALFNSTLFVIILFAVSSCGETKKHQAEDDSKEAAEEKNDETFETRTTEKDAQFLVNAAEIGLEEVKLAQLALTRSKNPDVKELATMMESEHTKANKDLVELAIKIGVTIPTVLTKNGEDAFNKLNDNGNKKFDKEYCDMMVNGHKKVIELFEKASVDATDTDIKNWAGTMLPTLRMHYEHSKTCKEKCDKI